MNKFVYTAWVNITSDKKKFIFMCCLILMGLLLWARLLILGDVPRAGYAQPGVNDVTAANAAEHEDETLQNVQTVYINLTDSLARDIFSLSSEYKDRMEQSTQTNKLEAKSVIDKPDPFKDQIARQEQIMAEADKLQLESIMFGKSKLAVINGEVVEIGGQIQGFILTNILDNSVIISKENLNLTLYMDIPGP